MTSQDHLQLCLGKLTFSSNEVHKGPRISSPLFKDKKKSNSAKLWQASTLEVNSTILLPSHNTPESSFSFFVKAKSAGTSVVTPQEKRLK